MIGILAFAGYAVLAIGGLFGVGHLASKLTPAHDPDSTVESVNEGD